MTSTHEQHPGERMHQAVRDWLAHAYDDAPCVLTRFVVVAEGDDGAVRWIDVGAYSMDGQPLPEWESVGMLDYATRVIRDGEGPANARDDDDDTEEQV